ncbi:MAG: hypothetical protein NVS3B8_14260 [Chitinophagaceae bacterium]
MVASLPDIISECSVTVTDIPMASENCAGIFMATTSDPLTYTRQGTYIITWQYNDGHGNIQAQQQRGILKNRVSLLPRFLVIPNS